MRVFYDDKSNVVAAFGDQDSVNVVGNRIVSKDLIVVVDRPFSSARGVTVPTDFVPGKYFFNGSVWMKNPDHAAAQQQINTGA